MSDDLARVASIGVDGDPCLENTARDVMLIISMLIEAAVCVVVFLAARRRSMFIYGLSITFGIYVVYDLVRLRACDASGRFLIH